MSRIADLKDRLANRVTDSFLTSVPGKASGRMAVGVLLFAGLLVGGLGFYWDSEPPLFEVTRHGVTGSTTISTMITMTDQLLNKKGGYLTNDITPPGIMMDNIPNWEFGALVQIRDMARILQEHLSRSQSQSTEDADLVLAQNQFFFDKDSWMLPETESEYEQGASALRSYLARLEDKRQQAAQFYARADNLRAWLSVVESRLGSLSQRLSASIGKRQLNTSLAGDTAASQSTDTAPEQQIQTPWLELDDVFYQTRGATWALIHLLLAIEIDFHDVLQKKNALVSLQQIIRELEPTQETLWSPIIMNGSGFGALANHSLVMGSHVSRANAAIADLRRLLEDG